MQKVFTGRVVTIQELNENNRCLQCGIVIFDKEKKTRVCEKCQEMDLRKCEACNILCREGLYFFYTYDLAEDIRIHERKKNKGNKTGFKEYATAEMKDRTHATLCTTCKGWQNKIKNVCKGCKRSFENTPSNYKIYGNYCSRKCYEQF